VGIARFVGNSGPFGIMFINPKVEFSKPIWTTITPKVKEDGKQLARKSTQTFDQETNLFERNMKAKHPTR
jgi:hypothetical protein